MKTRGLTTIMPLLLLAMITGGMEASPVAFGEFATWYGSHPIFIPRRSKFKGWMRERLRCSFNKTK